MCRNNYVTAIIHLLFMNRKLLITCCTSAVRLNDRLAGMNVMLITLPVHLQTNILNASTLFYRPGRRTASGHGALALFQDNKWLKLCFKVCPNYTPVSNRRPSSTRT